MTDAIERPTTPQIRLGDMITASWMSQAIYTAVSQGIPDLLEQGPARAERLAPLCSAQPDPLRRLMRALCSLGLCEESSEGTFALTATGTLLRSDKAGSVRDWVLAWGADWRYWGALADTIRTGRNAVKLTTGREHFDLLAEKPEAAAIFNRAMAQSTRAVADALAKAYDFSRFRTVADIGGGFGELLAAILRANVGLRGILLDLPHSIEGARKHLNAAGVADRCELISGSFFESVPGGADAYILKAIIHDWDDEHSIKILKNCRLAMNDTAKLLVAGRIIPQRLEATSEHRGFAMMDLTMMVLLGSRERSEEEFRRLLSAGGFKLVSCAIKLPGDRRLIEADCA